MRATKKQRMQLLAGLITGILFGFLLQKGGATYYGVIMGQLLLEDFTVVKIMLSAIIVGMVGLHFFRSLGWVALKPKQSSLAMAIPGGLIFGAGFALVGYCPGTMTGAAGQGSLDALTGGMLGMLAGTGLFALLYPRLQPFLRKGYLGNITLPKLLKVNAWLVVPPVCLLLLAVLWLIERAG